MADETEKKVVDVKNELLSTNPEGNNNKRELIFIAKGYENVKVTLEASNDKPEEKKQNKIEEAITRTATWLLRQSVWEIIKVCFLYELISWMLQ